MSEYALYLSGLSRIYYMGDKLTNILGKKLIYNNVLLKNKTIVIKSEYTIGCINK